MIAPAIIAAVIASCSALVAIAAPLHARTRIDPEVYEAAKRFIGHDA